MSNGGAGQYQVYPRGFMGQPLGAVVEKPSRPFYDLRNGLTFDLNIFDAQGVKLPFNQAIEKLYQQLVRADRKTRQMDYREQVLLAALNSFGTRNFYAWYRIQRFSPLFGHMHQRFLEDTIKFISTGDREYSLDTWLSLLTGAASDDERRSPEIDIVKKFFGLDAMDRPIGGVSINADLTGVIQQWVSRPYGYDDLIFTLRILFGANS